MGLLLKISSFSFVALFCGLTNAHAEYPIECVPDNEIMRGDAEFSSIFGSWKARKQEVISNAIRDGKTKSYWGKSYVFPTKEFAIYWIDGLDSFGVDISRRSKKKLLINASSIASQREYRFPKVDKEKNKQQRKKSKHPEKEDVDALSQDSDDRKDFHIEVLVLNKDLLVEKCSYEIRGSILVVRQQAGKPVDYTEF